MEPTDFKTIGASNFLNLFAVPGESRLQEIPIGKPASKRERTEKREIILQEIYSYYLADKDNRKRANWKKYYQWCKDNYKANTPENVKAFKRSKLYIREVSFVSFSWCLKHLPLEDFYVVLSEVKDRSNRGNNVSSWIGSLFYKNV